ncbi:MAG: hypothetical protein JW896_04170 [Deltaproteobacteria bacterium]|nr:hypothetical protein [Deltaproteobacteria bacterium]
MYKIEKTDYGFRLEFGGFIQADEMREWYEETKKALEDVTEEYKVLVDMRKMKTLPPDAKKILEEGQRLHVEKGGRGSAVIVSNAVTKEQQRNLGARSGVGLREVYIDGSDPDWEQKAMNWLLHGVSPE